MAGYLTELQEYIQGFQIEDLQRICQDNVRAILVIGASVGVWWLLTRKPRGIPPGPRFTLPIVGDLLCIGQKSDAGDMRLSLRRLRKKYGDIYSVYMGPKLFIVLNGYNIINEALVKNGDIFSNRPSLFINDCISKNRGLVLSSGQSWKEQRKFALETLREFGFGRKILERKIHEEIEVLIGTIGQHNGVQFDMCRLIQSSVSNVICSMVFGKRFEYTDQLFNSFLERAEENFQAVGSSAVINLLPILRFVPGDPFKFWRTLSNVEYAEKKLVIPSIEQHINNYDENNTDDFISCYIKEMKKEEKLGQTSSIDKENLVKCIGDLFIAGTETTSTTILWTILYFLHHPKVHERCYKEIYDVIGSGRLPSMNDKPNMPYVEAVTMEILRITNITIIGVPHAATTDTMFQGYRIPHDAIVIPNLDSLLGSDDVWGDANVFRPERFLDSNGQIIKREEFVPFSLGRRACLGEAMAKMELFLFLTTLVQRFDFQAVNPENLPPLKGTFGITYAPLKYEVKAIPR